MCDASNNAAPQPACLIFAKQFAPRNDILREEVCHFWTLHIRSVRRVGWVERKRNPSIACAEGRWVSLRSTHPTNCGVAASSLPCANASRLSQAMPAEVTHSGRTARNGYFYHSNDAAG